MGAVRLFFAQSLDGYIAAENGSQYWLAPWQDVDLGIDAFLDEVSTLVIGRKTFEQSLAFGDWAYEEKRTIVLSSSFPQKLPKSCSLDPGPLEKTLVRAEALSKKDVWIMGGAQTMGQALELDVVDRIDVFVIPVILGGGIPALPTARMHLFSLGKTQTFERGIVKLAYERSDK